MTDLKLMAEMAGQEGLNSETASRGSPGHVLGACFAMAAFVVAVVAGLARENTPSAILLRAVLAMIVCYPVGMLVGMMCLRVLQEHVKAPQETVEDDESTVGALDPPAAQVAENAKDAEDVMVV